MTNPCRRVGDTCFRTEVTVQLDAPQESDEYRWVKIKAAVAGGLEEGWVAGKYLEVVQ